MCRALPDTDDGRLGEAERATQREDALLEPGVCRHPFKNLPNNA